jgi:gliding motility-associated-like protein
MLKGSLLNCSTEIFPVVSSGQASVISNWSVVTAYNHGPNDLANGFVQIYYETTNNGGCQVQRDTINIGVIPSPVIDFDFSMECFGTPTDFNSSIVSSEPMSTYSWTLDGNEFSTDENPSFIMPVTGTNDVTFIAFSQNGCSDTITIPVSTYFLPEVAFNTPAPCLNGGTQYFDETVVPGGEAVLWDWSFGDGGGSTSQDPLYQYGSAGTFTVSLIVTSDQGCIDSVSNVIEIYPGPSAAFSNNPEFANVFQNVDFTDLSTSTFPIVSWLWDFADGNSATDQNTSHSFGEGGDYDVMLIVEDENGCIDTAKNVVHIYLPPLVPSGFSPNGDNNNDFLFVYGGPFETLEFKVYNNWGEVIFESNDASIGWDGTYKNVAQPIGVYVWTVKATTTDGAPHEISGDSSLIR